jgi:glutamate formiminotransferase/formiminotetrahydrofolate cyclodeaminase
MPRFADLPIAAFCEALSNPEPTPGGGTAAAVGGAIGASLLMMVAGLPKTRTGTAQERVALDEARAALASVRERMLVLADQDTEAYNGVIAAYRMAKATDDEKGTRKQAIQKSMRLASDVPLDTLRTAAEAMRMACTIAQYGNPSAASDLRVALELLEAAAAGAAANVQINLQTLDDEAYRKAAADQMIELTNRITQDAASARAALNPV